MARRGGSGASGSRRVLPRVHPVHVHEQIEVAGRVAHLREEQGRLAAVLGRMVDLMDQHLPEGIGPSLAPGIRVADHPRELGFTQSLHEVTDRKSTRLNSSHSQISYAVFCLKKKHRFDYLSFHL